MSANEMLDVKTDIEAEKTLLGDSIENFLKREIQTAKRKVARVKKGNDRDKILQAERRLRLLRQRECDAEISAKKAIANGKPHLFGHSEFTLLDKALQTAEFPQDMESASTEKTNKTYAQDMPYCNVVTPDEATKIGCHQLLTKVRPFCLGPRCMAWRWVDPLPIPDYRLKDAYIAEENNKPTHGYCGRI